MKTIINERNIIEESEPKLKVWDFKQKCKATISGLHFWRDHHNNYPFANGEVKQCANCKMLVVYNKEVDDVIEFYENTTQ